MGAGYHHGPPAGRAVSWPTDVAAGDGPFALGLKGLVEMANALISMWLRGECAVPLAQG